MSDYLRSHGLQHARLPCPSLSPRVCSNSCPLQWCHPTNSSTIILFSFRLNLSQHQGLFQWVSPSHQVAKVLELHFTFSISPSNEYSGLTSFRIDWFDLLVVQGTLWVFSNTTVRKHQFFSAQPSLWSNSHILTWLLGKP